MPKMSRAELERLATRHGIQLYDRHGEVPPIVHLTHAGVFVFERACGARAGEKSRDVKRTTCPACIGILNALAELEGLEVTTRVFRATDEDPT